MFHPGEIIPPGFVCWRLWRLTDLQELLGVQIMNVVAIVTREKATSRSPAPGHGVNEQQGTVYGVHIYPSRAWSEVQGTVWSEYGTCFLRQQRAVSRPADVE